MDDFPRRGDIWIINWNPSRGSEQAGRRPALVIQNDIGNQKAPTTIVAAISSQVKLYPMNVLIEPPDGGLKNASIVTTSQILTVSRERLERKLGRLGSAKMDAVNRAIRLSLALD